MGPPYYIQDTYKALAFPNGVWKGMPPPGAVGTPSLLGSQVSKFFYSTASEDKKKLQLCEMEEIDSLLLSPPNCKRRRLWPTMTRRF